MLLETLVCCLAVVSATGGGKADTEQGKVYRIEGKVLLRGLEDSVTGVTYYDSNSSAAAAAWTQQVYVTVDNGKHRAFLKNDGWFTVNNVSPGSYIVEVSHPNYEFDAIRVYISSDGKIQAHRLNHLHVQPSKSPRVTYPLRFKSKGRAKYFESRTTKQQIVDPMTIMTYMPLIVAPILLMIMLQGVDPAAAAELRTMEAQQMDVMSKMRDWTDLTEIVMWLLGSRTDKRTSNGPRGKLADGRNTNNSNHAQPTEHSGTTTTPATGSSRGQPRGTKHKRRAKH